MSATGYQINQMLRTYGRQVVTARRLARYRRSLEAAGAEDAVKISAEAKRRDLVQRVTAEIVENLLITGSENPIVEDVKAALEQAVGHGLVFAYPPEEQELQIFRRDGEDQPQEIVGEKKARLLEMLWELALIKVDATMI